MNLPLEFFKVGRRVNVTVPGNCQRFAYMDEQNYTIHDEADANRLFLGQGIFFVVTDAEETPGGQGPAPETQGAAPEPEAGPEAHPAIEAIRKLPNGQQYKF